MASSFARLLPGTFQKKISEWLEEDVPAFDVGGFVVGDAQETATLWQKAAGVVAGVPFFDEVFQQLGCRVEWLRSVRVPETVCAHNR
jgi:nicotinate-nucleotide pyrophosphorylase (carboxylating)